MALKTFNLDEEVYRRYSAHCKRRGMSMSKQIEFFMREKLDKLSQASSIIKGTEEDVRLHLMNKYC